MQITLIRTGGIIPITKKASKKIDFSAEETENLIRAIKTDDSAATARDHTQYQLLYNNKTVNIDLDRVPKKYKGIINSLKENLKIVKPK